MGPERRLAARRLLMGMPTSTLYSSLNLYLAMVVAGTAGVVKGGEASTGNGNTFALPQRLVRREFLRFGKRSGEQEEETLGMESEPNFEGLPEVGMSEIYDGNSLQDDIAHEAKQRSFLRFGKRSENYIRFGKKADFDHLYDDRVGKKSEITKRSQITLVNLTEFLKFNLNL